MSASNQRRWPPWLRRALIICQAYRRIKKPSGRHSSFVMYNHSERENGLRRRNREAWKADPGVAHPPVVQPRDDKMRYRQPSREVRKTGSGSIAARRRGACKVRGLRKTRPAGRAVRLRKSPADPRPALDGLRAARPTLGSGVPKAEAPSASAPADPAKFPVGGGEGGSSTCRREGRGAEARLNRPGPSQGRQRVR